MKVKRLKATGAISVELPIEIRERLFHQLVGHLELCFITMRGPDLTVKSGIDTALYYYTLNDLVIKANFHLQSHKPKNIKLTYPQAIALMWFLREADDISLLTLKSGLHQILIS